MSKAVDNVNQKGLPSDEGLMEHVHALMHRFRSLQVRAGADEAQGVTQMEGRVLGFFARNPGATQSDLALHSGRDKAQLARLIKGLRERDLLGGAADEADRRNLRLQLTAAGTAVHQALQRQRRLLEAQAVQGLTAAERRTLIQLLDKVKASLEP